MKTYEQFHDGYFEGIWIPAEGTAHVYLATSNRQRSTAVLTGVVIPLSDLPYLAQHVAVVLPLTHGMSALRATLIGAQLDDVAALLITEAAVGTGAAICGVAASAARVGNHRQRRKRWISWQSIRPVSHVSGSRQTGEA